MIFGFLPQDPKTEAVAVAFIMSWQAGGSGREADQGMAMLAGFRRELYSSLGMRRDALSEVAMRWRACRSGCTCWRSCAWSQSAAAGTEASTMP